MKHVSTIAILIVVMCTAACSETLVDDGPMLAFEYLLGTPCEGLEIEGRGSICPYEFGCFVNVQYECTSATSCVLCGNGLCLEYAFTECTLADQSQCCDLEYVRFEQVFPGDEQ